MNLAEKVKQATSCEVADDASTLAKYSRDTSIFARTPKLAAYPKSSQEVSAIVKFVSTARSQGEDISVTGRSAGTDMTGGVLTDSIAMVFTKYMNHFFDVGRDPTDSPENGYAVAEPGMYYRDFEKKTRDAQGMIYPAYPASRDLCAIGGIVSNNSGGELNLKYGKTNKHVRQLEVVLSDGSIVTTRPLSMLELSKREMEHTLEGKIYREIHRLIKENREEIVKARPSVTKNSAGYNLWDVLDEKNGTFDLNQLLVGSQGTLAMVTKAKLGLIKPKKNRSMLVIFMADLGILPEVVKRVLANKPESFESYDDKTFSLAVRYAPQMLMQMGFWAAIKLAFAFIPDVWAVLRGGVPRLVLLAEFAENTQAESFALAKKTEKDLCDLHLTTRIAKTENAAAKYWKVRRESFALLRKNVRGRYAAPFIDDIVVHPSDYPKFLPELDALVSNHRFIYTIAGHIGDGNFHIIPLVNMNGEKDRAEIFELMPKVYELVAKYKGSTTGEHNDGILRTPYLPLMFSPKMIDLFQKVKDIFDPQGVFNPGKKVGGTVRDIERSILKHL